MEVALEACATYLVNKGATVEISLNGLIDLESITHTFLSQLMALLCVDLSDNDYKKAQADAMKLALDDRSLEAFALRGQVLSYRDFGRVGRTKTLLRHQWRELFNKFDVVLCPVMPISAFAHDHSQDMNAQTLMVDDRSIPYGEVGLWCSLATLTGQPSTVMPIGQCSKGLPIGMQIIGPFLEDLTTITFAHCLEREFGGFKLPPMFL